MADAEQSVENAVQVRRAKLQALRAKRDASENKVSLAQTLFIFKATSQNSTGYRESRTAKVSVNDHTHVHI